MSTDRKDCSTLPIAAPVYLAFLLTYLLFFIGPVFLNSAHEMQLIPYIPTLKPAGSDLKLILSYLEPWYFHHQSSYAAGYLYPPFGLLFYGLFLALDFSTAYALLVMLILAGYLAIAFLFPLKVLGRQLDMAVFALVAVSGLFSYGFQFELERGQFNVITSCFTLLAIYLFHYHPRARLLAYASLCVAVQLKLSPIVFALLLVSDWRDWKANLARMGALAAANIALLFIVGPRTALEFLHIITQKATADTAYVWKGNHSIHSFTQVLFQKFLPYLHSRGLDWLYSYAHYLELALLVITVLCLLAIVWQAYAYSARGIDPYLLLGCTLCALLVPSISHDYTLPLLVTPFVMVAGDRALFAGGSPRRRNTALAMVFLLSLAYFSTLYSYTYKPEVLANNLPALLGMLILTTLLAFLYPYASPYEEDDRDRPLQILQEESLA